MTDGRRRWARITTATSAILLLLAVISLWQVYDDYIDSYDPERNYIVKLEPGDSETFEIGNSILVSALRVSEGDSPDADLSLFDSEGNVVSGRAPGILEPDRVGPDKETWYSSVRVFEGIGGQYRLENNGESTLWLVDDEESANDLAGNVWMYLFYIGCCIGSPVGMVGFILAIMVWTDKRKMPDQFVIIEDGSVIIGGPPGDSEIAVPDVAPSPFVVMSEPEPDSSPKTELDESWKSWDDG